MHDFGGPILPKHLVDGQHRSESAKGAERMRRHQSGIVCNTYSTVCIYTYLRFNDTQYASHMSSIWSRCNDGGARILASTCLGLKTPSHSYDDLSTVRSLRYDDMVDAVMLDFLFGSNMHLVQLIAIQYNGQDAQLSIALPPTTHHAPIAHCTICSGCPKCVGMHV